MHLSERELVAFAKRRFQTRSLGCWLDSAGSLHQRSRTSLISGRVRALFFQHEDSFRFHDLETNACHELSEAQFSAWLTAFQYLGHPPWGARLFPLLTYEAFNPYGRPEHGHPLWPEWRSVWLLSTNTLIYDRLKATLYFPRDDPAPPPWPVPVAPTMAVEGWRETEAEYRQKIRLVQEDIYHGRYYQANLSQRFAGRSPHSPLRTYARLRALNPSPFMGIFRLGDYWILSGSPERLVAKNGDLLSARPIAGTKPRFPDPLRDDVSRADLVGSAKERAEHLMLLDLIRNDLGSVARPGSVQVREFGVVESYSHVHHLVSEVEARLRPGTTPLELITAMFPGGTITGAPKIACIRRLAELENEARGPYTGSMGFIDTNGNMDLNILIRTLIQRGSHICFHAGGGIVADSLQTDEFLETRHKCRALMEALSIEA